MEHKKIIQLKWQNRIFKVRMDHYQFGHDIRSKMECITQLDEMDDEPKQIQFYLYGSLVEVKEPDLMNEYLEKMFVRGYFMVSFMEREGKKVYIPIYNPLDAHGKRIWISNDEARVQLE